MSRKIRITGVQIMAILALLGILLSVVGSAVFISQTPSSQGTPIVSSEVQTVATTPTVPGTPTQK